MQERGTITLNFPAQVKSITSGCLSQTVTTSGQYMTSTDPKDYTFTCKLEEGYKISGIDFTDGTGGYNSLSGFTDDTFTISISSPSGLTSTVGINVSEVQKVQKSISLDNLAQFKAKCDETYAKVGEGGITLSQVIAREETLPAATADSPDFVEVGGVLYRKKAVDGGSLLGTWVFNDMPNIPDNVGQGEKTTTYNINFLSDSKTFSSIVLYTTGGSMAGDDLLTELRYDSNVAYYGIDGYSWDKEAYKTIQITDISALTNEEEFTSWLTANATKQGGGGASVTYSYVALADA